MDLNNKYIKEACVEGLQQALNAEKQGADRIELCARLDLDGLTPDFDTIKEVKRQSNIPIRVIIRPREGDFNYSEKEFQSMKQAIETCKAIGVEGVVFGITTANNMMDLKRTQLLVELAHPMKVTIHKAIDAITNPIETIKELIKIEGIDTILTSGKGETWQQGQDLIKHMIKEADENLVIMPCGKITDLNINNAHKTLRAEVYHGKLIVGKL
ncbi:copper homeostasis protein CutC [Seonamhaeicola aphaedonensis]|uniref:Copper homeostasis protein cutC homolog n=1 Tax=Seonamhaeicola aphaedonensis TaxID=1461338 RepID=A0A3D9HD99_9FLAO|nr:copper homeostasis protein CutC [Seonamhaeicola aphaedonensis]RED47449.1 copper homeostasis protein CutC [Seonamhaeicola aphaedonensis]